MFTKPVNKFVRLIGNCFYYITLFFTNSIQGIIVGIIGEVKLGDYHQQIIINGLNKSMLQKELEVDIIDRKLLRTEDNVMI